MPLRRLGFARWISAVPSGGNRYDDEIAAGLRDLGIDVAEYVVPGPWPAVDPAEGRRLAELLLAEQDWLVDNSLAAGAPEAITAAHAAGRRVTVLVHYFPADEIGWSRTERDRLASAEGRALAAADGVIATSRWSAAQLGMRYGIAGVAVAVPGVEPAPCSPPPAPGEPPRLLWLGRITRTKDPLTLVGALARLRDLGWTAWVIGPDRVDPAYTTLVRAAIEQSGLGDRVAQLGSRCGPELEADWAGGQLLISTSRVEPYGMVVTEALARGIPSVVPAGTGAVEAQRSGAAGRRRAGGTFPSGDDHELAAVLRGWLTDSRRRRRWRSAAIAQRSRLPTWRTTVEAVLANLSELSEPG
ncbi:MAG TPA: glycosyltransferase family 4 protein [Propionibacteriaceae bacterium]|nr:glycosyltransferase family 4 protein [Propionibacteriaceae bacterium]